MRLDGALEPHHGAPTIGGSIGVIQYRYTRCKSHCDGNCDGVIVLENSNNNYKNNNNNNNNSNNNFIKINKNKTIDNQKKDIRTDDSASAIEPATEEKILLKTETLITNNNNNNYNNNKNNNNNSTKNSNKINEIIFSNNSTTTTTTTDQNKKQQLQEQQKQQKKQQSNSMSADIAFANTVKSQLTTWSAPLTGSADVVIAEMMRAQESLKAVAANVVGSGYSKRSRRRMPSHNTSARMSFSFGRLILFWCLLFYSLSLLPSYVRCDDSDNFFAVNSFSMRPETTTPEFDYASRGQKKFGDKCENTLECGFPGSICDPKKKSCQCTEDLPVTNHIDKCGKEAAVNESCFFNEQCEVKYFQTECRDGRCVCRFEMSPIWSKDGSVECKGRQDKRGPETYIDPAMIGVLVGMALMFIIICVVLRLFSQARWRENRTIFNTPNPRLMNVSLLRDSKLLHGQERRGSRMSVRAPSRQPSMASLRPHSPNPSLGKTGSRSGSHGSASNASATSIRSTRSNSVAPGNIGNSHHERKGSSHHHHQHHQQQQQQQQQQHQQPLITNITSNPVAESVTVEIIEPEK